MIKMEESHLQNPNKVFEILRALGDGNLVSVHLRLEQEIEDGWIDAVMHSFRFENNKIFELWSIGEGVPDEQVNENEIL